MRTWLHVAHLQMGGEKMAKSTGNVARAADLLAAGASPRALRYALIAVHYRAALKYSDEPSPGRGGDRAPGRGSAALAGYHEDRPRRPDAPDGLDAARDAFDAAMDQDLNVSAALGGPVRADPRLNRRVDARSLSTDDASVATAGTDPGPRLACLRRAGRSATRRSTRNQALLDRERARADRDWAASDRLRDDCGARHRGRGHT